MVVQPETEVHDHVLAHPVHQVLVAVGGDALPGEEGHQEEGKDVEHGQIPGDENVVHHVFEEPGRNHVAGRGKEHAPHRPEKPFPVGAGAGKEPKVDRFLSRAFAALPHCHQAHTGTVILSISSAIRTAAP
ncbi:hypothetical protein SDC9_124397 [bioreactor metagenome]|uniref:Uncharacterized protein n=1 Tax=bioreactor metagenome TaxID=1076179 RepID=A0A645CKC9_9ZZZZ